MEQQESKRRITKVEDLVSVEIVYALLHSAAEDAQPWRKITYGVPHPG